MEVKDTSNMGRPTDDPKVHQTRIRMTQSEWEMLNYCAEALGTTKTDIVNQGIENIYKKIKTQEKENKKMKQ